METMLGFKRAGADLIITYHARCGTLAERRHLGSGSLATNAVQGAGMLTDIIVHMDRGAGCTARLMAAIDLASRHGGRLKGLYVITHPHYTSSSSYLSDFAQVREFFVNATSKAGIETEWLLVDWNTVGTPLAEIVTNHSHYADTILVGQPTQMHSRRTNLIFTSA